MRERERGKKERKRDKDKGGNKGGRERRGEEVMEWERERGDKRKTGKRVKRDEKPTHKYSETYSTMKIIERTTILSPFLLQILRHCVPNARPVPLYHLTGQAVVCWGMAPLTRPSIPHTLPPGALCLGSHFKAI